MKSLNLPEAAKLQFFFCALTAQLLCSFSARYGLKESH